MFKGNILGQLMQTANAGSAQEGLEGLAGEGRMMHFVPGVLWALYPPSVVIWMTILRLGLAKLAAPIYVELHTMFMVMALSKAGGSVSQGTQQSIAELSSEVAGQYVADPLGIPRVPSKRMVILGEDMVHGTIGYQIFR